MPHMGIWRRLLEGETWQCFQLQHRAPLYTGDAIGLSELDLMDGILDPDVLPPSELVHARSQQWAKDDPLEAAEAKAARGKSRGRIPLMVATSDAECKVIPAKLFELWRVLERRG